MKVLLVEDDIAFAVALARQLRGFDHIIDHAPTVREALAAGQHDLVLLDLNLPDGDGMRLCRTLREASDVPIIILSARIEERDRIAGLRVGADDFLIKPFSVAELQARIEAVARRYRPRPVGVRSVGELRVDLDAHRVSAAGIPIGLTRKEFHLLAVLIAEPGRVVPRDRLIHEVWQTSWRGASRTLDVHVGTLRTKLSGVVRLETVRGVGYRITATGSEAGPVVLPIV